MLPRLSESIRGVTIPTVTKGVLSSKSQFNVKKFRFESNNNMSLELNILYLGMVLTGKFVMYHA